MPFTLLLLLISLAVIVPVVFVIKEKSQQRQIGHNNNRQRYITNKAKGELHKARPDLRIADTIMAYRNNPKLPISFRQLLGKIHEQFSNLSNANLSTEQRFTVDKLAGTRLPEVLEDYLALEPDFAENTIIDETHNLTSQDVTYGQLTSMLTFMQKIADDGQEQVANNILANRGYLQSVYGDFYQDDSTDADGSTKALKAPKHDDIDKATFDKKSLYDKGFAYLQDCDELLQVEPISNTNSNDLSASSLSLVQYKDMLSTPIVTQLGQLLQVAERTITYSDALLPGGVSLQAFDKIISQALPSFLRQTIASHLKTYKEQGIEDAPQSMALTGSEQERIEQRITRCGQLLEACLTRLERAAKQQNNTGSLSKDTLQLLTNTINSKQSQAQYLLDSGFFKA